MRFRTRVANWNAKEIAELWDRGFRATPEQINRFGIWRIDNATEYKICKVGSIYCLMIGKGKRIITVVT